MSECYLYSPPGDTVALTRVPPDDPSPRELFDLALDVVTELSPVARPLAADLLLACRTVELPFLERDVSPRLPFWHLREARPPAHVTPRSRIGVDPQVSVVPELTREALAEWFGRAVAQDPPGPEYRVTFTVLACHYMRARVYDEPERPPAVFPLRDGKEWLQIPIERRTDGLWVSAPIHNRPMYPPVSFEIAQDDGVLNAIVRVSWSSWARPGLPEHGALEDALRRIVARGWEPASTPHTFKLRVDQVVGTA